MAQRPAFSCVALYRPRHGPDDRPCGRPLNGKAARPRQNGIPEQPIPTGSVYRAAAAAAASASVNTKSPIYQARPVDNIGHKAERASTSDKRHHAAEVATVLLGLHGEGSAVGEVALVVRISPILGKRQLFFQPVDW